MSSSQHPVALEIERRVGGATKLLATVMFLPLLDGIFPALVLAGAVDSVAGIVQVGLLVFGGSATVAVILAEMDGTPREQAKAVLAIGIPLIALAAVEAAVAPSIREVIDLVIFERFAALVILAIAAKTASARVGEYMPRPAVIVGLGLLASVDPSGFTLAFVADPGLVARGAAAAAVGVGFALSVALLAPALRDLVHLDRFRFGSAVALGLLPLSLTGLEFGEYAPLAVLALTTLFALDPSASDDVEYEARTHGRSLGSGDGAVGRPDDRDRFAGVPDGGDDLGWDAGLDADSGSDGDGDTDVDRDDGASDRGKTREPWL